MPQLSLRILLALSLLLAPLEGMSAAAYATPQVIVEDVAAGFETVVHVRGLTPSQPVQLHVISPSGEDTAIPLTMDTSGNRSVTLPSRLTAEAGTYRAFGTSGNTKLTPETTFRTLSTGVHPTMSTVTVGNPLLTADGRSSAIVTVTLRDSLGNALAGRIVQLVGSRAQDRITPLAGSKETDAAGRISFAIQTQTQGDIAIRAMDLLSGTMLTQVAHIAASAPGAMGGFQAQLLESSDPSADAPAFGAPADTADETTLSASAGIVDHFDVTMSVEEVKVKDVIPRVDIVAKDRNGATVTGFTGTLQLLSDDKTATLPGLGLPAGEGSIRMDGKNRGKISIPWSVAFGTPGTHTLTVILPTPDGRPPVSGEATVNVTGTAIINEANRIRLTSPKDGDTIGSREIFLEGTSRPLQNLNVWVKKEGTPPDQMTDGEPDATGDTDDDGAFAFTVEVPGTGENFILQIQDATHQFDSGIVHVQVDTRGPELDFAFSPDNPHEGDDVTLTVTTEQGLDDVTFSIGEQNISLTESDPGTWQVLFQAPGRGDLDWTLSGRDAAGNVTDENGTLGIDGPLLPQVQNVQAVSLAGGIALHWDLIPDDTITDYRIEVGRSPGHTDTTLDTDAPVDGTTVMGLKAGTEYFVTVRARRGDELGPKTAPLSARTLGMELTVSAQDSSLLLQWTFPDTTPLSSFLLEYGTAEGEFSEQRTLEGSMRAFTLKDLLAQEYEIRLTPISTTGNILSDLTVTAQGTPERSIAFHASADELRGLVPGNDVAPDNTLHEGAPNVPGSGLPGIPVRFVLGLTAVAGGLYWYRRRKIMKETQKFLAHMHNKYRQ